MGCREVLPKRTLIRIVRTAEAVQIDPTGKTAGRGAYLHNQRSCWERGMKGVLAQALKVELSEEDKQNLLAYMASLPKDVPALDEESNGSK